MNVAFKEVGGYPKLILDYLDNSDAIQEFINYSFNEEAFLQHLEYRKSSFTLEQRTVLVNALNNQYKGHQVSEATQSNIEALLNENSFTVVTGHQLNIFTGPLYFFYKILTVIKACEQLAENHPDNKFVPVFWMATEDHDFEEIAKVKVFNQTLEMKANHEGAVGRMSTEGLKEAMEQLKEILGENAFGPELYQLFEEAYGKHDLLTDAHRSIVNALFGKYGLVVIDGDDKDLKESARSLWNQEIEHQKTEEEVLKANKSLKEKGYKVQVNPRPVNLFYLDDKQRKLLWPNDAFTSFSLKDGNGVFTAKQLKEIDATQISPNVLMRPMYQEMILPNLAYCGGANEMAYWFELKQAFEANGLKLPVLMVRNSVTVVEENDIQSLKDLGIDESQLFAGLEEWKKEAAKHAQENNEVFDPINDLNKVEEAWSNLQSVLKNEFPSLEASLQADQAKYKKLMDGIEQKVNKTIKKAAEKEMKTLEKVDRKINPDGVLQERKQNFIPFYFKYGSGFVDQVKDAIDPFDAGMKVVRV